MQIYLESHKKIYIASDFHLGGGNALKSRLREQKICCWLDEIKKDAQVIFLVGDLFDFWFEYKQSIPKGFSRFFGKLAEISDLGIQIIIFKGNHDLWMSDYFQKEFGAKVFRKPQSILINQKSMLIGHGDGLGPGDYIYKLILRPIFESFISKFLFGYILPSNIGLFLGKAWANYSWRKHEKDDDVYVFHSEEKEILLKYCKEIEKTKHHDFYVFGHRHYKMALIINGQSTYYNLGDWIGLNSFGVFDGNDFKLKDYDKR